MEKILSKSKSMLFGRKKSSEDNVIRDSDSFYDMDDYAISSSPRTKSQTVGLKTKNALPIRPFAQPPHPSHIPSPGSGGYNNNLYNTSSNRYASRRDTQPPAQSRINPIPQGLGRSSSTSEAKPLPTLSLNAHGGERYRLEMNSERGRGQSALVPRHSDQFRLTDMSKNEIFHAKKETTKPNLGRTSGCQPSDKPLRGCSISAPITSGLLALETKYDPATNRSNVQGLRSSAENGLTKHIPTLNHNSSIPSNRLEIFNNENKYKDVPSQAGISAGGISPLRGRRSLNFFNTTTQMLNSISLSQPPSSSSLGNEKGSASGPLVPNEVRYGSRNSPSKPFEKVVEEGSLSKIISSPIFNNDAEDRRLFHSRAASDTPIQPNSVQPLSLRTQPKYHQKLDNGRMTEGNGKQKGENSSPTNFRGVPSPTVLQASASLPTPPTSSTTLSFIASHLDIPEFDTLGREIRLPFDTRADAEVTPNGESESLLTRADLEAALKFQDKKLDELCERVSSLSDSLNEETTCKRLLSKRISHLENEIRGLRWIINEAERVKRAGGRGTEGVDSGSRESPGQAASEADSSSRYEESSNTCNTSEKDRKNNVSSIAPRSTNGFAFSLRTNPESSKTHMNRRKRFGLALDPQASPTPSTDSTSVALAPFRGSAQVNMQSQRWGEKI